MAGTAQSRINGSWRLALGVAGLFIAAGMLSLGVATFATTGLNKQITTLNTDVTSLRERTTAVETLQPIIMSELQNLDSKVDLILARLPVRAISSPASDR